MSAKKPPEPPDEEAEAFAVGIMRCVSDLRQLAILCPRYAAGLLGAANFVELVGACSINPGDDEASEAD